MTEYTPEKVAELVGRLREVIDTATSDSFTVEHDRCVGQAERDAIAAERDEAEAVRDEIIAALTAVAADVEIWKQETDDAKAYAVLVEADLDRLHKAITEALDVRLDRNLPLHRAWPRYQDDVDRILCAALEQKAQAERDELRAVIESAENADRGLPVFQLLQDEYGVTAEELRRILRAALDKEGNDDE